MKKNTFDKITKNLVNDLYLTHLSAYRKVQRTSLDKFASLVQKCLLAPMQFWVLLFLFPGRKIGIALFSAHGRLRTCLLCVAIAPLS